MSQIYAFLKENVVVKIHELTDEEAAEICKTTEYQQLIDITYFEVAPGIGWIFNGHELVPPSGSSGSPLMIITRLAMRNRFTPQEKMTLYTVAASPQGLAIKIYLDDLAVSTFIDLAREETILGINYLAQSGIITQERANIILTTKPSALEVYKG